MSIVTAEEIAKTEKLTRGVLLREVIPMADKSLFFKQKKEELLQDLSSVASYFDLDERVIIYCFIRLWKENRVRNFNFWESFETHRTDRVTDYLKNYYDNLEQQQTVLWED